MSEMDFARTMRRSEGYGGCNDEMAKRVYIGVGGKARKVKKIYIGVAGVARKVKKAYIGVGGVARLCFSSQPEVALHLTSTPFTDYASKPNGYYDYFSVAAAGNIAVYTSYGDSTAIGNTLAVSTLTPAPNMYVNDTGALSTGNYAVFLSGYNHDTSKYVYTGFAYDASGTLTSLSNVPAVRGANRAATTLGGSHGFCFGATDINGNFSSAGAHCDSSLTINSVYLDARAGSLAGASNSAYAVFGGGTYSSARAYVRAFNISGVSTDADTLNVARYRLAAANIGDYVIFAGGYTGSADTNAVDIYDASLTHSVGTGLTVIGAASGVVGCGLDQVAMFFNDLAAGGSSELFDASLTQFPGPVTPASDTAGWGRAVRCGQFMFYRYGPKFQAFYEV